MNPVVDKWIDEHTDELVARVRRCIAFPTVLDESTAGPGAPFGRVTAECLEDTLAQGREMGFEAKNLDGYCGYIDFGAGEEQLALICHLDVVPEGTGWLYPPYAGEVHDGRFYGRGTMDDKGPAFAALFGMAAIKASGLEMKRRVRLILGCNEESGMECMKHYKKVEKDPDIAFSPDAEYPVVNSEKSGYHGAYHKLYASKVRMHGGTVSNAVPGEMVIEVPFTLNRILPIMEAFMEKSEFACAAEESEYGTKITMKGLAAHASTPEIGHNAFLAAIALLDKLPLEGEDAATVAGLVKLLGFYCHGEGFGLDCEDKSGRLTFCPGGIVDWDETGIKRLTIDIRAPISCKGEDVTGALERGFGEYGLTELNGRYGMGHYVPEDSELVSTLLDVYAKRFGKRLPPLAIGGGTYAKCFKAAVAFGIERPGEAASIHMPNENIEVTHLVEDCKVMADAIIALACK